MYKTKNHVSKCICTLDIQFFQKKIIKMYFISRVIGNFNAKAKSYSINFNLHKDMTATLAHVTVKPNGMQNKI